MTSEEPWQRVLWKKQPFSDDFVPPDFFRVTKRHLYLTPLDAVSGCTAVTLKICSCMWIVSIFFGLQSSAITPNYVILFTAIYTAFGFCLRKPCKSTLETLLLVVLMCGYLAPLVQSLTASISTDTIYACTTTLLILHVMLHDYGLGVFANGTLGHNVGVFACVCLASRLNSHWQVFSFSMMGIAMFASWSEDQCPAPRSRAVTLLFTLVVTSLTLGSVVVFSPHLLWLFVVGVLISNPLLPLLYVTLQGYRENIYGPWDEAKLDEKMT